MTGVEDVLQRQRQLEIAFSLPPEARVHRGVGGNDRTRQFTDMTHDDIELVPLGKLVQGPQHPAMLGVVAFPTHPLWAGTIRFQLQSLSQEHHTAVQSPRPRRLIAGPRLDAAGLALNPVAYDEAAAGSRLHAAYVVMQAMKSGDRVGDYACRLRAVTELEGIGHL